MKTNTAGRKKLPPQQKKVAVTIYLTREEIEQLGGMNELKKHLTTVAKMKLHKRINQ